LESLGLLLKVVVLDQESTQQMVMKNDFKVTPDESWLHIEEDQSIRIYVVWDVPHLLKNIRNQLRKYLLQVCTFQSLCTLDDALNCVHFSHCFL
jgi:hypothetical protein